MNKRNKVTAIFAASMLALGVAGIALATDLHDQQVGTKLGDYYDAGECAAWPVDAPAIGAGQIGVHFVLTSPDSDSGNLTAAFSNPASSVGPVANFTSPANTLHFYVVINGDGNTVIDSASTDTNGTNLNISHACPGAEVTAPPTEAPPTEAPSFEQSQADTTEAPSFEQSQADIRRMARGCSWLRSACSSRASSCSPRRGPRAGARKQSQPGT
jgi:hypothetical protein